MRLRLGAAVGDFNSMPEVLLIKDYAQQPAAWAAAFADFDLEVCDWDAVFGGDGDGGDGDGGGGDGRGDDGCGGETDRRPSSTVRIKVAPARV